MLSAPRWVSGAISGRAVGEAKEAYLSSEPAAASDPYPMSISLSTAAASRNARRSAPSGVSQVQVSPASVVAELNAVVGVPLEAADDDDTICLTVLGTLVCQHGAKLRVAVFHVLYLCAGSR